LRFPDTRRLPRTAARRALVAGATALVGLLLPGTGGATWITNSIALDTGPCGRNLQVGSNTTASAVRRPTFLLQGDGGLSSYAISIDGRRIGTFGSDARAVVCIRVRKPLADGPHILTGVELRPKAGRTVRLRFSVDTVPPRPPSRPVLERLAPAGTTADRMATLRGTAAPHQAVRLLGDGVTGLGGAISDADGRWLATTMSLPAGTYRVTAVAVDSAGNRSAPSAATTITIPS
jgi:hypothetical protein